MSAPHLSVLKAETLQALNLESGHNIIDCTVGAGGHAEAILQQIGPAGHLLGLDRDANALKIAQSRLAPFAGQFTLVQTNFDRLAETMAQNNFPPANGILADLGVSSMQFDQAERGFSFQQDGPLDMRMNPNAVETAQDLVNNLPEEDLASIIYRYGEEHKSRRIARAIVQARPINSTLHLAETVAKAVGGRKGKRIHPATKTFQALRIAVNDELGALERFLPQAIKALKPKGRLAIISFHSLEDRMVKHYFQTEAKDCICPPEQLFCTCNHKATVKIISKKPITATPAEQSANPRARSAKLRVAERKELT